MVGIIGRKQWFHIPQSRVVAVHLSLGLVSYHYLTMDRIILIPVLFVVPYPFRGFLLHHSHAGAPWLLIPHPHLHLHHCRYWPYFICAEFRDIGADNAKLLLQPEWPGGIQVHLGLAGQSNVPCSEVQVCWCRYMLEINLAVAGFFLTKNIYSSAFFFLAAIIYIFVTFISHNYTLRKDYLCCKSMEFLILFKIIIVLVYTIDCVGYYVVEDSTVIFLCLVAVHFLFSVVLVIAYLAFGYYMYRHTVPMVLQVTIVCLYTSLSGGCLYDEVLNVVEGVY